MDNQRLFLWIGLALVLWFTYQQWLRDYGPQPVERTPETVREQPLHDAGTDALPELPATDARESEAPQPEISAPVGRKVRVVTDVLDVDIDMRGADLRRAVMLKYPVRKDDPDKLVTLLDDAPADLYTFHTGISATARPDRYQPYESEHLSYELGENRDEMSVVFVRSEPGDVEIEKVYTFRRDNYRIAIDYKITNNGNASWSGRPYMEIQRRYKELERSMMSVETYSFRGPVIYDGDAYEKLDFEDIAEQPIDFDTASGWIAGIQHHFLAAAIPRSDDPVAYRAQVVGDAWYLRAAQPAVDVAPGASESLHQDLFVGPKIQEQLADTAKDLKLTVDYGFLTILSQPLFWLLSKVHAVVKNWGWSIVVITILIKLLFYRLSQTSGQSMAKMRKLQPRIKHLQDRYKDDRQKLSQAMMELYKKEKVNPAAGCLPILVQMPVFLAFYWVLLESVELRQAHFMLWITDLSSRDPYFILPILMGLSMLGQQKLNPAPPDPVQAKVMMAMPIVFTVFFAFFPAGLVLYWFVNTLLSIAQQWRINKVAGAA